jgi:hypothetical protein
MELAGRARRHVRVDSNPYPAWALGAECTDAADGGGIVLPSFRSLRFWLIVWQTDARVKTIAESTHWGSVRSFAISDTSQQWVSSK